MNINIQLKALYEKSFDKGIHEISEKYEGYLDGPHLMYCWEEEYNTAEKKILFIGQEPNTWVGEAMNEIERPLEKYKKFGLAKETRDITTFWSAVKELNKSLNPKSGNYCFLWTNVSKYSTDQGKKVKEEEFQFINQCFNVLQDEIKILNPDVIIFFSGPNYDNWIIPQFGSEIKFEQIHESIPKRELARLVNKSFPKHTYRTYHPISLQRQKKWNYIHLIANSILEYDTDKIFAIFKTQIFEVAEELQLTIDETSEFTGLSNTGFYFYKEHWKHCAIGFEFERSWAGNFFYGICRKDMNIEIPQDSIEQINQFFGAPVGVTEFWPWWKWFKHRNWDSNSLDEIQDCTMKEEIKNIVINLVEKLEKISTL